MCAYVAMATSFRGQFQNLSSAFLSCAWFATGSGTGCEIFHRRLVLCSRRHAHEGLYVLPIPELVPEPVVKGFTKWVGWGASGGRERERGVAGASAGAGASARSARAW